MNLTDLGNAERLIERYGKELRFCHPWGKFLLWDGKRWRVDEDGATERRAKETVRAMYEAAGSLQDEDARKALASWALKSESAGRLMSMISLAQSEPGVPVHPDKLDADPWLFNCLDGVVDIRTGELRKHEPALLMTKIAPFSFDPDAKCPKWIDHLALVMDGNGGVIDFLQRAWGSCLTGITDDRKLFITWGSGKNGKSVCNDTIAMVLGDYTARTPTETLLVKRGDSIPNDLARLPGARFVYASESESGRRLSEGLIKDLTGGEKITARFLHKEWFEFRPTFNCGFPRTISRSSGDPMRPFGTGFALSRSPSGSPKSRKSTGQRFWQDLKPKAPASSGGSFRGHTVVRIRTQSAR
jgi:putative DNA primase/helicase